MATAADVLRVARGEIGYSRWDDPQPGTKYGRWYASLVGSPYYGTSGVPFCAMGASWAFAQAGAKCVGLPGAYCPTMLSQARAAGRVRGSVREAQPGDVIYFNWHDGGDAVDHVGIVEANCGTHVQTIEFNTSNGRVARRTRSWDVIAGVVAPDWGGEATGTAGTTGTTGATDALDVDGWAGQHTTLVWQRQVGTVADGVISGQSAVNRQYLERLVSVTWEGGGSQLIQAVQRKVGVYADGYIGPETVKGIQRWLNVNVGAGLDVDGYLGPLTAMALQRSLNDGRWRS